MTGLYEFLSGAPGSDNGVTITGVRPFRGDAFSFGTVNYLGWDTFSTFYTEASYHTVSEGGWISGGSGSSPISAASVMNSWVISILGIRGVAGIYKLILLDNRCR